MQILSKRELIAIEFRTIIVNGTRHNNVMYVEPIVKNIEKFSILYQDLSHQKVTPSHILTRDSRIKTEETPH